MQNHIIRIKTGIYKNIIYFIGFVCLTIFLIFKTGIVSDFILQKIVNNSFGIEAENLKFISINKIFIKKIKLKKQKNEIEFFDVNLKYNIFDLLRNDKIKSIEFKDFSVKFDKSSIIENLKKNRFYLGAFEKNKYIFKDINCKVFLLYDNKNALEKIQFRSFIKGAVFQADIVDFFKNIKFNIKFDKIKSIEKENCIYIYPSIKGASSLDIDFTSKNNLMKIYINELEFKREQEFLSLKSKIDYKSNNNYKFLSKLKYQDKLFSFESKIKGNNSGVDFYGKINSIFLNLLKEQIKFSLNIKNKQKVKRIKVVIGDSKKIYLDGLLGKKGFCGNLKLKNFLDIDNEIKALCFFRQNKGLLDVKITNIHIGRKYFPDIKVQMYLLQDRFILKKIICGKNLICGKGIFSDKHKKFQFKINSTNLDILDPLLFYLKIKEVKGIIEGNLNITGDKNNNFNSNGDLNIYNGRIGELEFKFANFKFNINKKNIILSKSKIILEEGILLLNGVVDFNKTDPFENVLIETDLKIMSVGDWKLVKTSHSDNVKFKKKISEALSVCFRNKIKEDSEQEHVIDSVLELEYGLSENDKLVLTMDSDNNFMGYKRKYEF
jgi:hypothetical protein